MITLVLAALLFLALAVATTWFARGDRPRRPPASHPADEFDPRVWQQEARR